MEELRYFNAYFAVASRWDEVGRGITRDQCAHAFDVQARQERLDKVPFFVLLRSPRHVVTSKCASRVFLRTLGSS
jgi:hypothetical protein